MATPMRSTDFRSIVEPILNEEFNGIYDQRADEWSQVFKEFKVSKVLRDPQQLLMLLMILQPQLFIQLWLGQLEVTKLQKQQVQETLSIMLQLETWV